MSTARIALRKNTRNEFIASPKKSRMVARKKHSKWNLCPPGGKHRAYRSVDALEEGSSMEAGPMDSGNMADILGVR
jgi:hypothetical protein